MKKNKILGFIVSAIAAVAILITPMVASANTVGNFKAYINWVNPGYVETTINVTYNGNANKLLHGDGSVTYLGTTATNSSIWCHYGTGTFTAFLGSYDSGGYLIASDSNTFYNP